MPVWITWLGGILKALGLVEVTERLFERWQAKQSGVVEQKATDDHKAVEIINAERQADADGPHDVGAALARLRDGTA